MYMIRYQKMNKTKTDDGKTAYTPARAYSVDDYETTEDYLKGVVQIAQTRVRGWKYRLMVVDVDASTESITARFDWAPTAPTE